MFCTNCGANIDDGTVVCSKCGVLVNGCILPDATKDSSATSAFVLAIIAFFCCMPLAIPSLVFAFKANSKLKAGDVVGFKEHANVARIWAIIGIVLGIHILFWAGSYIVCGILLAVSLLSNEI